MATDVKDIVAGLDEAKRKELLEALGVDDKPTGLTAEAVEKMLVDREAKAEEKRLVDEKAADAAKAKHEEEELAKEQAKNVLGKGQAAPDLETKAYGEEGVGRYVRSLRSARKIDIKDILDYGKEDIAGCGEAAFVEDFQVWSDDVYLASRLLHDSGRPKNMCDTELYKSFWGRKAVQRTVEKALYTGGSGNTGEDWIPTAWSQSWIDYVGTQGEVLPTFPSVIIPQGTTTLTIPAGTRSSTMYLTGESSQDEEPPYTTTTPTSRKVTLTPKTFAMRTLWSQELVEDSVASTFERVRNDLAMSAALGIDEALIHGDASAHGFDTGAAYVAADRRKAFDGLRYRSKVTCSAGAEKSVAGWTWTMANKLMTPLAIMGKWGGSNPVMLIDKGVSKFLGLIQDTATNLVNSPSGSPEQAASAGAPRRFLNTRFIESEALRTDLTAAGIYDGTTKTCTQVIFYNPDGWQVGTKRAWTVETEKIAKTQQWELVMTMRMAFAPVYVAATEYTVGVAYGIVNPTSW